MNVILIYCNERKGKDEGKLVTCCLGSPLIERKSFILVYRQCTGTHYQPISCPFSHTSIIICDTCSEIYRAYFFCFIFAEFSNRFTHNSSQGTLFLSECCSHLNALTASSGISCHNIEYTQHRLNILTAEYRPSISVE